MVQLLSLLAIGGLTVAVSARSARSVNKELTRPNFAGRSATYGYPPPNKRNAKQIVTTEQSKKFAVNGAAGSIPLVDFDIGESYAGLLPIGDKKDDPEMYFWYFPTENEDACEEIVIWLNGGPGCSSLEGFLQENGPISWQYGSGPKPVYNPWNWANLTNMVWVEQPIGTGFTQGKPTAQSQEDVAEQFLGFFKNFVDTFGLHNRKIYITGESYAGRYVPFIADAMLAKKDEKYFNAKGAMIYDPSIADNALLEDIPAAAFMDEWAGLFNFNKTFTDDIHSRADSCGYTDYLKKALVFPPTGKLPTPSKTANDPGCAIWNDIYNAAFYTNPCFDVYQVATTCPLLWDPLGFPGSFDYVVAGTDIYFNRTDVQKAINAPIQPWSECANGVLVNDTSAQSSWEVIPRIIDGLDRTMIVHGELDMILLRQGSLMTIQNMTWGGVQGFQTEPADEFYVPYHTDISLTSLSAKGIMGVTHTERKLTWVQQALSGHMVPQYQPSSAYRQLEFLLGRVDSLSSRAPFTTLPSPQPGNNSTLKRTVAAPMTPAQMHPKWL